MTSIRAFNPAKLYAETLIHPIIKSQSDAKIVTRLGAINVIEANKISPAERIVNRYNASKERTILQQTLINEIEATVLINNVKAESNMLNTLKNNLEKIEQKYEEDMDSILTFENIGGIKKPTLTPKFDEVNKYLDTAYVQIQRIMTKNKLLFTSENDDLLEDYELKEKIKADNLKS